MERKREKERDRKRWIERKRGREQTRERERAKERERERSEKNAYALGANIGWQKKIVHCPSSERQNEQ